MSPQAVRVQRAGARGIIAAMGRASALLLAALLSACSGQVRAPAPVEVDAGADAHKVDARPDLATEVADANDALDAADALDALDDAPSEAADAEETVVADAADTALPCDPAKTCVGAPMPTWALEDFQPKSSGFKKIYGLSAFKPKVTVVALLAGW